MKTTINTLTLIATAIVAKLASGSTMEALAMLAVIHLVLIYWTLDDIRCRLRNRQPTDHPNKRR